VVIYLLDFRGVIRMIRKMDMVSFISEGKGVIEVTGLMGNRMDWQHFSLIMG